MPSPVLKGEVWGECHLAVAYGTATSGGGGDGVGREWGILFFKTTGPAGQFRLTARPLRFALKLFSFLKSRIQEELSIQA